MSKKKLLAFVLAAAVSFGAICDVDAATRAEIGQITVNKRGSNFKCWNKEITKKNSKSYIPIEDRVAVFDMDGTILCETAPYYLSQMLILDRALNDKSYTAPAEDRKFAQALDAWLKNKNTGKKPGSSSPHFASVFSGLTDPEYTAYVKKFMAKPVEGLGNLASDGRSDKISAGEPVPGVHCFRFGTATGEDTGLRYAGNSES